MFFRFAIPILFLFSASADLPHLLPSRAETTPAADAFPPDERIPLYPIVLSEDDQGQAMPNSPGSKQNTTLQESSKLKLIRYVSGEFAKARKPIPGGKDGFTLFVDKSLDEETLNRAVTLHGAAVNTGDNAQITRLEFREHTIIVDVNGGGRPKRNWRDHIQIGMGDPMPTSTTTVTPANEQGGPPGFQQGRGGTIYLQFGKNVPDLTPDDLKTILAPFLDFSKERSAAVHWIDTLPPEMKKAITERRAVVGMDRDEVVAAIGKPDRKVRERDAQGNDTEDWIYGHPPDKTVFVHFTGERVTGIKQYPQ